MSDVPVLVRPKRIRLLWGGGALGEAASYRQRPIVARHSLTLRWSAFSWFNLFMVACCGIPLALIVGATFGTLVGFGLIAAAALFSYLVAAVTLNRVVLHVDGDRITSKLSPFPVWPAKTIPVAGITNVVAAQSARVGNWEEATNVSWYVVAIVGEVERPITRHLRTREEAVFVARTIEEQLGLREGYALDEVPGNDDE